MKMKNTARNLKNLIKTGEGYHLEFKKSLDKSFPEEICAFANASGGKVLVGVADDGTITGTATDNVSCSRIQDVINQIEPQIDARISNPGGLPSGLTAQTFGTKSLVRNPIIAALLHRSGYIEKIGITPNGIKYHLDKLRRQGVIRHVGATKKGCWELVEDDD